MTQHDKSSGHKHDASDRALDKSASAAAQASDAADNKAAAGTHDPAETRKHDDLGKDRLFEGRQQHDEAEKNSEKSRLAKDVAKHGHGANDGLADGGTDAGANRTN